MRREAEFLEKLKPGEFQYIDGATDYCMLVPFAEDRQLKKSERLWLAYLYGLTYSCTSSMRLFIEFPDPVYAVGEKFQEFWYATKSELYFNPDKARLKNSDSVIPAIESIVCRMRGRTFLQYYKSITMDKERPNFEKLENEVMKHWKFFGYMGFYLFLDAVYGLCPKLYIDPPKLNWKKSGNTVVEGMAYVLGQEERIEAKEYNLQLYDTVVERLQRVSGQPKVVIESVLCAFRKVFKGTRYDGYYADRMKQECINFGRYLIPYGISVWEYRRRSTPKRYRQSRKEETV